MTERAGELVKAILARQKALTKTKNLRTQTAISEPSRPTHVKTARSNFFARCSLLALARNK